MLPGNIKTSPSGATCWATCLRAPSYQAEHPEDMPPPMEATNRGAEEHDLAEALLTGRRKRTNNVHVRNYVDYCRRLPGMEMGVELKLPVFYRPERSCFVDYCKFDSDTNHLHIVDLKTGEMLVKAYENKQCAIYARSIIEHLKPMIGMPTKVVIHIYAPRQPVELRAQVWTVTPAELVEFQRDLVQAVEIITDAHEKGESDMLDFVPGEDQCRWCVKNCPGKLALIKENFAALQTATPEEPNSAPLSGKEALAIPGLVTDEMLGNFVRHKKMLIKVIDEMVLEASKRSHAEDGDAFLERAGLKYVEGRAGVRKWVDGFSPFDVLGAEALADPKPLSPTQVEDKLGVESYDLVRKNVVRKPAAPVLVDVEDKRTKVDNPTVKADKGKFKNLES
jgi:hypothetical protein